MEPNPDMFVLARESREVTQIDLARDMGVSQALVSKVEHGERTPTLEYIESCATHLRYPTAFFFMRGAVEELPATFFRKRTSLPLKKVRAIRARASIQLRHLQALLRSVEIAEDRVAPLDIDDFGGSGAAVATELRHHWRLPSGPIDNMTTLLEDRGIIVVETNFGTSKFDGLSIGAPTSGVVPPTIFARQDLPGDRWRYTLAHELAHVLLHHHTPVPRASMEAEADDFAHEFLLPSDEIRPYLGRLNLDKACSLKRRWGVSMQTVALKARRLNRMTDRQLRYFYVRLAQAGYSRSHEPDIVQREHPSLLREIVAHHIDALEFNAEELAHVLAMTLDEFESWYRPDARALRVVK